MYKKYIIIIIFLLIMRFTMNSERSSVLYEDNGLFNILELSKKPRIARKAVSVRRSAPKFLLNIYTNVLSKKSFYDKYEESDISAYVDIVDQSDFIMTFGTHNPHSGNRSKTNRGKRIWFDVSEVPQRQHIISAELRLYHSLEDLFNYNKTYTVAIYRVAERKNGRRIKHFINSANTTKEEWITLNISQTLDYWVNHPKENRGLFIAVHDVDRVDHILRPDDIGIVGVSGVPEKQPFMVGFFRNSGKPSKHNKSQRQKRDDRPERLSFNSIDIPNNPHIDFNNPKRGSSCDMKALFISFKDLRWDEWIIAPEGYDAFYCSGECDFPLHMNASNHAIIQTLMHLRKPDEVPKPCCVPSKLSPLSVIYFLDERNVVLKKFENMVTNSCGCH